MLILGVGLLIQGITAEIMGYQLWKILVGLSILNWIVFNGIFNVARNLISLIKQIADLFR